MRKQDGVHGAEGAIRGRLTYSNVMSTIAVFGVLAGGGAYAASKIGAGDIAKNAVRAKHIKKNAVKTRKIANGAVTAPKLAEGVGGALAFADVRFSGPTTGYILTAAKNVSQANIERGDPGVVCFRSLSFSVQVATTSPITPAFFRYVPGNVAGLIGCPDDTDAAVLIEDADGNFVEGSFTILFN